MLRRDLLQPLILDYNSIFTRKVKNSIERLWGSRTLDLLLPRLMSKFGAKIFTTRSYGYKLC